MRTDHPLEEVRPKVWRRLLVPLTTELPRLHVMLLWGTGWDGGLVQIRIREAVTSRIPSEFLCALCQR